MVEILETPKVTICRDNNSTNESGVELAVSQSNENPNDEDNVWDYGVIPEVDIDCISNGSMEALYSNSPLDIDLLENSSVDVDIENIKIENSALEESNQLNYIRLPNEDVRDNTNVNSEVSHSDNPFHSEYFCNRVEIIADNLDAQKSSEENIRTLRKRKCAEKPKYDDDFMLAEYEVGCSDDSAESDVRENDEDRLRERKAKKRRYRKKLKKLPTTSSKKRIRALRLKQVIFTVKNKRGPKFKKVPDPYALPKRPRRSPKDPPVEHVCPICDKSFKYKSVLEQHQVCHDTAVPLFICEHCGLPFKRRNNLRAHLKLHEQTVDWKPHLEKQRCPQCFKLFTNKHSFETHMTVHTGYRAFPCTYCPKAFKTKNEQKLHIRTHTGEKPFPCPQCGKSFSVRRSLKYHLQRHVGDYRVKCTFEGCEKGFITRQDMLRHLRRHTNERPYKCDKCSKAFKQQAPMCAHRKTHTGEHPFECCFCQARFIQQSSLNVHLKSSKRHSEEDIEKKYSKPVLYTKEQLKKMAFNMQPEENSGSSNENDSNSSDSDNDEESETELIHQLITEILETDSPTEAKINVNQETVSNVFHNNTVSTIEQPMITNTATDHTNGNDAIINATPTSNTVNVEAPTQELNFMSIDRILSDAVSIINDDYLIGNQQLF